MDRIVKLKRNDMDGAIAIAKDLVASGEWTPEAGEMLIMLQDDQAEIIELIDEITDGAP